MRLAFLISGGGTTATAIINACKAGQLKNVQPVLVIASQDDIRGIDKVKTAGMKAEDVIVIKPQDFAALEAFGQAIVNECQKRAVDFIGQYGWLCLTPKNVIKAFQGKMVNQHPGPLDPGHPDFGGKGMYGRRVHAARLMFVRKVNRDFWTEATAQRVAVNFDQGAVLKRKRVPILENDDVDALQARVLPLEHEVQIETLQDFSNGTVKELNRDKPLVLPGEESILEECKREAIRLYPER